MDINGTDMKAQRPGFNGNFTSVDNNPVVTLNINDMSDSVRNPKHHRFFVDAATGIGLLGYTLEEL